MGVDSPRARINIVSEVSEQSVLLTETSDSGSKLSQGLLILHNCHGRLLRHTAQHLILLSDSKKFSLSLLQLLVHDRDALCLVVRTPLMQIENPFLLPIVFQLALRLVQLGGEGAYTPLHLLDDFIVGLYLLTRQLLHLLLGLLGF